MSSYAEFRDAATAAAQAGDMRLALEILERYRNDRLVAMWCRAENIDVGTLDETQHDEIVARIQDPQTGPGDLTVEAIQLFSELRDLDDKPREFLAELAKLSAGRIDSAARIEPLHIYDSIDGDEPSHDVRLFGNTNIGDSCRCNLEVSNQLDFSGLPTFLSRWAVTTIPVLDSVGGCVRLVVNHRFAAQSTVNRLLRRPGRLWKLGESNSFFSVEFRCDVAYPLPSSTRLYVHLDGWRIHPAH